MAYGQPAAVVGSIICSERCPADERAGMFWQTAGRRVMRVQASQLADCERSSRRLNTPIRATGTVGHFYRETFLFKPAASTVEADDRQPPKVRRVLALRRR